MTDSTFYWISVKINLLSEELCRQISSNVVGVGNLSTVTYVTSTALHKRRCHAIHVYKCIFHVHGRFKNRHICGTRHVCLKAFIFLWRRRPNSTKHWGRTLYFHFAPAIVMCKSCEVRKDFTSLKANILTAVSAVEAAKLIHTAITFSLSED